MGLTHSCTVIKSKTATVGEGNNVEIGRYEGKWSDEDWVHGCAIDGSNFAAVKTTQEGSLIIDGFIEWTILKSPVFKADLVGYEAAEEVIGYFDTKREMWICGYRVWEHHPETIGREVYKTKLVGNQINCSTKWNNWGGKLELHRVATKKELRDIFMKFTPLGAQASCAYLLDTVVSMVHYFDFPKVPRMPRSQCYMGEGVLESLVKGRISEALLEIRDDRAKPYVHKHPECVLG